MDAACHKTPDVVWLVGASLVRCLGTDGFRERGGFFS